MTGDNLAEIADRIHDLTAAARTTADKQKRTQCIEEALALACKMTTKLDRRLSELAACVLKGFGLSEEHATLAFRDLAQARDELADVQSKEAMLEFLAACRPMLEQQLFISPVKVRTLLEEVRDTYENFIDQKVGVAELEAAFKRLSRFFCRPPWDSGGGSPLLDGGPTSGPSHGRGETVCRYLDTFAAIGSFLVALFGWLAKIPAGAAAKNSPPMARRERTLALTGLLMLSGFSNALDESEEIPAEDTLANANTPVAAGSGADKRLDEDVYA